MKKMFLNILTLSVTTFLLIITIMAWYISNKEVKASGIIAQTASIRDLHTTVKIYSFSRRTNDVFTIDTELPTTGETIVMRYDPNVALDQSKPSLKLIEIDFLSTGVDLYNLSVLSSTSYFAGYNNTTNPGWVTTADLTAGLPLSSVVNFKLFDSVVFDNNDLPTTVTFSGFDDYTYTDFADSNDDGLLDVTRFDLLEGNARNNITKIFILLDFNKDSMERLFSNNLGNNDMEEILYDDTKNLTFNLDFKFLLTGEEVTSA